MYNIMHDHCSSIYDSKILYSTITHNRIEQNMMLSTSFDQDFLRKP